MNLVVLIIVFSIGNIRETFARSVVVSSAIGVQDSEAADARISQNDQKQISGNYISYLDNQAALLVDQIQQYKNKELSKEVQSRIEEFIMLKQQSNNQRQKRRPRLTPCLFKICNMGRKRQHHVLCTYKSD
ncbi:uncharacterized protein LOC109535405 [Dendroctonus ponderosae]|uniref:Uncharacterized protein n=1 Tax=Dendroctonus ponderosae TaxID=77166 RepID=A0AAR5P8A0_DENPD|nr:uncharacterized protein LOC109535405 [Dendroctonus ponderosae]KAH1003631.1 hypothetical protein HUJ04_003516 [Dendroctonus ponderosae]KAH1010190.1 hypothetical protein HUJ05_004523 [Dendroctonus ponderosae]